MWDILRLPLIASLVMSPVHCLFGLHIVRRGVIFIDLAVAQMAALGMAIAIARGHEVDSTAAYWLSLSFALGAALAISLTRFRLGKVPHEAIIGIMFVVASALGIVVLRDSPHGPEELRDTLSGSLLFVQQTDVMHTAWVYGLILVVSLAVWRYNAAISLNESTAPRGLGRAAIDIVFYGMLAFVVASSVKIAGVLVVFTWLVMPPVIAMLYVAKLARAMAVALPLSVIGSCVGVWVSSQYDWATGPAIVIVFGAMVTLAYLIKLFIPRRFFEEADVVGEGP
jgi:zinc/manganese transport system permease protein